MAQTLKTFMLNAARKVYKILRSPWYLRVLFSVLILSGMLKHGFDFFPLAFQAFVGLPVVLLVLLIITVTLNIALKLYLRTQSYKNLKT
jgi:hypothetical protein